MTGAIETGVQNPTISAEDALIVATSASLTQVWEATINASCALIVGIKFLPPELSVRQFQLHPVVTFDVTSAKDYRPHNGSAQLF